MIKSKISDDDKFTLDDRNYGKSGVKILYLVKNGSEKIEIISKFHKSC
jgi:hypothetical protein